MSISLINTFTANSHNQNTNPTNRMDCSSDGQHVIVYCGITNHTFTNKALHYAPPKIFISNDSGATFREQNQYGIGGDFKDISVPRYGNYRWLIPSVRCDSTGQYMLTVLHDREQSYAPYFQYSTDYGATWEFLFNTNPTTNNQMMENFAISEPINGAVSPFPCYIAFEHRGQIWVRSPLTSSSTMSSTTNLKLNDISMSDDGSTILCAGRDMGCKYSTDYGATFSDVPTLSKGACCSISGTKMVVVDYGSGTKNVEYSANNGSSWTSSQITIEDDFHEASIGSDKTVFSGENGSLYSSNDGYIWTQETSNLTDTLNGLVSYDSGFFFLNSAMSGERTFYSLAFSGSETPTITPSSTIYLDTAPIVQRFTSSITEASTISFTIPFVNDLKHYKLTLLHETSISGNPAFVGDLWYSSTEQIITPILSQRILQETFNDNVLTFTFNGNYTGTYTLSVMRSS